PAVTAIRAVQKVVSGEDERTRYEPVSDAREREAAAVAEEIARLLHDRPLVRDPDSREVAWVPLRPRHIAVLFRTRTPLPYFERAFAVRGIPYVTAAGQGFYERAEVLDCLMLLRVLAQPLDDLAMAAVLRSPFVGVSDADLWRLRRPPVGKETPALYHALGDYIPLADFLGRFKALRRRVGARSAADALDIAIRDFGYEAALAAHEDGPAMLANLSKLRRQLRAMGAVSPAEAYRQLARTRDLMTTEATAPTVGPADDVAVLTTIHQAKGLEWPIVCLPNLQSAQQDHDGEFSARHGALLCAALDPDGEEVKPLSVKAAADELRARREAEERRLLYVALTRARERLILSACVKEGEDESKYKGQYAAPLDFLMAHTERTLIDEGEHDCGSYLTRVRHIMEPVGSVTQYEGGQSLAAIIEPREIAAPPDEPPALSDAALPLSVKVTELLSFGRCPQVYRFAHVLEIEEHTASRASARDPGRARPSPVELGTIVHSLLERARFDAPDTSAEISRLVEGRPAEQRAALARMLEPVLTGELGAAVRGARRVEREWPFAFEAAGVLVEGVMDLALQGGDGRWTVVDYKSNDISRAGRRDQLIDYYTPQLELYALALSRAGLGDVAECALVFLGGPSVHRWAFDPAARNVDEWAQSIIKRIAARDYTTSAGPKCERCGYLTRKICRIGRSWTAEQPSIAAPGLRPMQEREP
ncbi:MAG TPA: 3'-5' exonuclease, partial [Gemmatimonadaceae bacterium]